MRHCGITVATAIPATDTKAMMKEKALVAWMSRQDMAGLGWRWNCQESFLHEVREKTSVFLSNKIKKLRKNFVKQIDLDSY